MKIYIDGGCTKPNQKDYSKRLMIAVVTDENGTVLIEKTEQSGSNNIAEIWACYEALLWCKENKIDGVLLLTDSKNAKTWIDGGQCSKHVNDPEKTQDLIDKICQLRSEFHFGLAWIPREQNLAGQYIENKYGY